MACIVPDVPVRKDRVAVMVFWTYSLKSGEFHRFKATDG